MDGWMDGWTNDSIAIALGPISNHSTANRFPPLASHSNVSSLVFELLPPQSPPTNFSFQQPEAIRLFASASASVGVDVDCNQKWENWKQAKR